MGVPFYFHHQYVRVPVALDAHSHPALAVFFNLAIPIDYSSIPMWF